MAKIKCKGTVLSQEIATVMTAVAQITSLDISGTESETYDSTTLDVSDAYKTYDPTGYTEPGTLDFELFYDPALSGHHAVTDLLSTPALCDWQVKYADTGATTQDVTSAGLSFGVTVAMDDGLKGSASLKLTGDPNFATT